MSSDSNAFTFSEFFTLIFGLSFRLNFSMHSYVDHSVIAFLRRIRRLFQASNNNSDGICLQLDIRAPEVRSWGVFCHAIWPLIDRLAITKLDFLDNFSFHVFRRRIAPDSLLHFANVRLIATCGIYWENEANAQLLREWLNTPRADGRPKLLKGSYASFNIVEQLRTVSDSI